jgi:hypothetical protein
MAKHKLNIGLEILPPCQKCSVCKCFEKLNDVKFDEVCRRKYQHPQYQINIIGFINHYDVYFHSIHLADVDNFFINAVQLTSFDF